MSSEIIVALKNVWVRYDQSVVLENINLTLKDKEIVSIVGPNGGGKTTLLNTILGFKEPFRGDVRVFGENPAETERSGLIGYLPQISEYDRSFPVNVFDVVAMARHARKSYGRKLNSGDKGTILNALENVGMANHKNHHFGSLSGGQQHRVLIARALAGEPRLLVLDEPSTGLDAVAQDAFYHTLHRIRDEQDITIIMVSHDIGTVSSVVDQIACLNKKIHFHGKPEGGIPSDALEKTFGKHVHFLVHDEHCRTCEKRL
jgi:zinc transport system ATP-binding protein